MVTIIIAMKYLKSALESMDNFNKLVQPLLRSTLNSREDEN